MRKAPVRFIPTKDLKDFRLWDADGNEIGVGNDDQAFTPGKAAQKVGNGLATSIVTAPVFWIARQASSIKFSIKNANDEEQEFPDHKLLQLLDQPNEYHTHSAMWMAVAVDLTLTGNAYIEIERDRNRAPRRLYWIPSNLVKPKGSARKLITHYEVMRGRTQDEIEEVGNLDKVRRMDMIHIRYGINPGNQRIGLSPLASLINDVFTDMEAAEFTAAVLNNFGFPGVIVSPPPDEGATYNKEEAENIKSRFRQMFNRGNRGDVGVFNQSVKVDTLQVDMMKMDIQRTRQLPESRVCAVLGVPAAVVGFALGISQTKVGATMAELRKEAYESSVTPLVDLLVDAFQKQLIAEYPQDAVISQDRRKVRILREFAGGLQDRLIRLWESKLRTRDQTLAELGYPKAPKGGDEYYEGPKTTEGSEKNTGKPKEETPNDEPDDKVD